MPTDFNPARPLALTLAMCDWDQILQALSVAAVNEGARKAWQKADQIDKLRAKLLDQVSVAYAMAVSNDNEGLYSVPPPPKGRKK